MHQGVADAFERYKEGPVTGPERITVAALQCVNCGTVCERGWLLTDTAYEREPNA